MRGRLINPFLLELRQLDTAATAADPDAGGELTSGYDPDFKEVRRLTDGTSARKEKAAILLPAQVEVASYEQLNQMPGGNDPNTSIVFIFHFADLESRSLVDANGNPAIRIGDRATAIYRSDGVLVQKLGLAGQGLFCTEAMPDSFGLSGGERNLLYCTFGDRDKTYRGA